MVSSTAMVTINRQQEVVYRLWSACRQVASMNLDVFARGRLHTCTVVARLPLRQLGFLVPYRTVGLL